jgi:metal-responsive CopG/Arc/MetJ family transcriptional regulator
MTKKVSITLDDEVLEFVDQLATNRSSFINDILWKEKRRILMQELAEAYQDQDNDPNFHEENAVWDMAVGDGLDA